MGKERVKNDIFWKVLLYIFKTTGHKFTGRKTTGRKNYARIIMAGILLFLSGCDNSSSEKDIYNPQFTNRPQLTLNQYTIGVHPLHNPKRLEEVFGPVADYLSRNIKGANFRIEASRDYAAYDKKLYAGRFEFALPNPYQTVNSLQHGYRVFGKMGDDHNFRGLILVRKDSGIEKVTDLKGKAVSFPAPTALAATMMPQYYLQENGLEVMKDIEIRYVGSQESSIMNVFLGNTSAGATWPPPWRLLSSERPELKAELVPIWITEALPNNGLVVRSDVPEELVNQVSNLIFKLDEDKEGRKILQAMELSRFEAATNNTYQPVVEFLEKFSKKVRPLK